MKNMFFMLAVIAMFFTVDQPLEARVNALRGLRNVPTIKKQIDRAQNFLLDKYVLPKRKIFTSRALQRVHAISPRATEIVGFENHQAIAFNGNTVVFRNCETKDLFLFNYGTQSERILPFEEGMTEIYSVMVDDNQQISAIVRLENGSEELVVWDGDSWDTVLELEEGYKSLFVPNHIYSDLHENIEGIIESESSKVKMNFRYQKVNYMLSEGEIEITYYSSNGEFAGRIYGDRSVLNRIAAVRQFPHHYKNSLAQLVRSIKNGRDTFDKRGLKYEVVDGTSALLSSTDGNFYILKL